MITSSLVTLELLRTVPTLAIKLIRLVSCTVDQLCNFLYWSHNHAFNHEVNILSFIIVDHLWSLWIIVDHRWSSLIIVDHRWSSLIIVDHHWSSGLFLRFLIFGASLLLLTSAYLKISMRRFFHFHLLRTTINKWTMQKFLFTNLLFFVVLFE